MSISFQFIFFLNQIVFGFNVQGHRCQNTLDPLFKKYEVVGRWQQAAPLHENTELFRSETKSFGTWVDLELNQNNIVRLRVLNQNYTTQYIFNQECSYSISEQKHPQAILKDDLTDEKLNQIIKSKKATMIYLWSPRMVYSVKESRKFKQVADELGLDFISVVESNAGKNFSKIIDQKLYPFLKPLNNRSLELLMRGATIHYPSVLIASKQRLSSHPIVGVYNANLLKAKIYKQLDLLK